VEGKVWWGRSENVVWSSEFPINKVSENLEISLRRERRNPKNTMRFNICHVSLAFVLKFLNFLQSFVGISILLYSIWMFNEWDHRLPPPPLPHAFDFYFNLNSIVLPAPWYHYSSSFSLFLLINQLLLIRLLSTLLLN